MLRSIDIHKLHGKYDYNIDFNKDLTLLYGSNGCGKTTILNIVNSIITGKFYQLYKYKFESIIIVLYESDQFIFVYYDNNDNLIHVKLNDQVVRIKQRDDEYYFDGLKLRRKNINKSELNLEKKIKNLFNFIYLPLNRSENYQEITFKDYKYVNNECVYNYLDYSIMEVETLILEATRKITLEENEINKNYQKDLLSSSINLYNKDDMSKLMFNAKSIDLKQVKNNKEKYIEILKEFDLYDLSMKSKIDKFFLLFNRFISAFRNNNSTNYSDFMLLIYIEYLKVEHVIEIAEKYSVVKQEIHKPINQFQDIINEFFKYESINKSIIINQDGKVDIASDAGPMSLFELSSGEKQLIITFAKLIFLIDKNKNNVFIIDEPESSLHLMWQSLLIPTLLSIDKNIQFIFATHSPEIVGKFRNYTKNVKPIVRK